MSKTASRGTPCGKTHIVVGDGITALAFIENCPLNSGDTLIVIGENAHQLGRGAAYAAGPEDAPWRYAYLLNSPADDIDPAFARWLADNWDHIQSTMQGHSPNWLAAAQPLVDAGDVYGVNAPREFYGDYISEHAEKVLHELRQRGVEVQIIEATALSIDESEDRLAIATSTGQTLLADSVDIAPGGPSTLRIDGDDGPFSVPTLFGNEERIAEHIKSGAEIFCIGGNASMLDVLRLCQSLIPDDQLRFVACAPDGEVPAPLIPRLPRKLTKPNLTLGHETAESFLAEVWQVIESAKQDGDEMREIRAGFRTYFLENPLTDFVQDPEEAKKIPAKLRFWLRGGTRDTILDMHSLIERGKAQVIPGLALSIVHENNLAKVLLKNNNYDIVTHATGFIVNCAGASANSHYDPLTTQMIEKGWVTICPASKGLNVNEKCLTGLRHVRHLSPATTVIGTEVMAMPLYDAHMLRTYDEYLRCLAESGVLRRSKRRSDLIEYLLLSELRGEGDRLKAYTIALDVFERPPEFDPSSDSIVRVEVGRLRSALDRFEASKHANTRIHVKVPVGTYRPEITLRTQIDDPTEKEPDTEAEAEAEAEAFKVLAGAAIILLLAATFSMKTMFESSLPAIGVQIVPVSATSETEKLAAAAIGTSLSRAETIKVLLPPAGEPVSPKARFLVTVDVRDDPAKQVVSATLARVDQGQMLWMKTVDLDDGVSVKDAIEAEIAGELRIRLFNASKETLEARRPEELSPEELFVMATWVPGVHESKLAWELRRIELASLAVKRDPSYGAAHSVLADKLAYVANIYEPEDTPENREASAFHARRAMELDPLNPDVVFNVSLANWHNGKISESLALTKRVVELDSGHDIAKFLAIVIPYTCETAPDAALKRAKAFDASLSNDNPIRWVTLNWISWLHAYRGEWEDALIAEEAAARIFQIPYTFIRRAMILNVLGRTDEAKQIFINQAPNWPGITPRHFAETSIPNLCSEAENGEQFVKLYEDLVNDLDALDK